MKSICLLLLLLSSLILARPALSFDPAPPEEGVYLFIDDYWLESSDNVHRLLNHPAREFPGPILDSATFAVSQPFVQVLPMDEGGYRLWFLSPPATPHPDWWAPDLETATSTDAIHWQPASQRRLDLLNTAGTAVLDSGQPGPRRFKLAYNATLRTAPPNVDWVKTRLAFSPDSLQWTWYDAIDTLFPGHGRDPDENWGDIIHTYSTLPGNGRQYGLTFRLYAPYTWKNAEGVTQTRTIRRTGVMFSSDYVNWSEPTVLFAPDERDSGITEFYGGPSGVLRRGDLLIGFVKVLRDDLSAAGAKDATDCQTKPYPMPYGECGMGYTALAWSHDGEHWTRDREPFFEPNPKTGAWDHAHAWIDAALPVNDLIYLYYGGYKWGHKLNPETERQIGLVRLRKDRYVARYADHGILRTKPLLFAPNSALVVNADVKGELSIQAVDAAEQIVATCDPLPAGTGDETYRELTTCRPRLDSLGVPVRLIFHLDHTYIFGFYAQTAPSTPTPTPSPTPSLTPSPTSSATPTTTPSATPTPTPTTAPSATLRTSPSATPTPSRFFLPLLLHPSSAFS